MITKKMIALAIAVMFAVTALFAPVFATNGDSGFISEPEEDSAAISTTEDFEQYLQLDYDDDDDDDDDDRGKGKNKEKDKKFDIKNIYKSFKTINKLNALIMLLDELGYKEDAKKIDTKHPLYSGKSLGSSNGYIYLAIEKGILKSEDLKDFNPNTPAKRLDVVKYIIRAIGKEELALQYNDKKLDYKDSKEIPKDSIGYVYLATELKLFDDFHGQFKPDKPVTIKEMEDALEQIDEIEIPDDITDTSTGVLVSVDKTNSKLTIKLANGTNSVYEYVSNAPVYYSGQFYSVDSLKAGDSIKLTLNSAKKIIFIELTQKASIEEKLTQTTVLYDSLPQPLQAKIDTLKLTANYKAFKHGNHIYLVASRGEKSTGGYTINITEVYKVFSSSSTFTIKAAVETTDPAVNSIVTQAVTYPYHVVRIDNFSNILNVSFVGTNGGSLANTTITELDVIETISGTISEVDAANRKIKVKGSSNIITEYAIPTAAAITLNNSSSTIGALVANMSIVITKVNGTITNVSASDVILETSGTLIAVTNSSGTNIVVKVGNEYKAYAVNQDTVFKMNGTVVTLDKIPLNTSIVLKQVNGILKEVRTLDTIETISGAISEIDAAHSKIKVKASSNVVTEYTIPANAAITLNNSVSTLSALQVNMNIVITKTNGIITSVAASDAVDEASGTLIAVINDNGKKLVVQHGTEFKAYLIDQSTVFKKNGAVVTISDIELNSQVKLKLVNGILKEVIV